MMFVMVCVLFMVIIFYFVGDVDLVDVSVIVLIVVGVGDFMMFYWLMMNLFYGFCWIVVVDKKGVCFVGDVVLDCLECYGLGFMLFYQVDLCQLWLFDELWELWLLIVVLMLVFVVVV